MSYKLPRCSVCDRNLGPNDTALSERMFVRDELVALPHVNASTGQWCRGASQPVKPASASPAARHVRWLEAIQRERQRISDRRSADAREAWEVEREASRRTDDGEDLLDDAVAPR